MFHRDTIRLIKKTFNRFISLFMIVTIGVAFMVGLLASSPILRASVDDYFDSTHFFDIQLYSSYGFCDEDILALNQIEDMNKAIGSKMKDVYTTNHDGSEIVTRFQEIFLDINELQLVSGRMPENSHEAVCLDSASFGVLYSLGDTITIESENWADYFSNNEFQIVGTVKTPLYMAATKETSLLDNKDIGTVVFVQPEVFVSDYYTTAYLSFLNSEAYESFTNNYQKYIDNMVVNTEVVVSKQDGYLKDKLVKEYQEKIDDAIKILQSEKAKGQSELDEAKAELESAHIQLLVAKAQIETTKLTLAAYQQQYDIGNKQIIDNEIMLNSYIKEIEKQTGLKYEEVYNMVLQSYNTYQAIKDMDTNETSANIDSQIRNLENQKRELTTQLNKQKEELQQLNIQLNDLDITSPTYQSDKAALQQKIDQKTNEIATTQAAIDSINSTIIILTNAKENITEQEKQRMLDAIDNEFKNMGFEGCEDCYTKLTAINNGLKEIEDGKKQLTTLKKTIDEYQKQISEGENQIKSSTTQYEKGLKEYYIGEKKFNEEIEKAESEITKAKQDLNELPSASWTILDRNMHYSSLMYKNTIGQMRAIGIVIPVLFFLVAALVCMTTMTRLIDEQRSQLGLYLALGFSKKQIVSKYVIYAFLASISGALIGVVIGIFTFPIVIYNAWKLMYDLPSIHIYCPLLVALIGIGSFSALMMLVSSIVARKQLKTVPSQLMRPKAPRKTRKTFIENIGFIWRRLSFTSKITARNLIRYKSRFFMTVIGVAGCTALLLIGFGVKDSIADILKIQYKQIFHYDNTIILENDYQIDELLSELRSNYDNEAVVPYVSVNSKVYLPTKEATIEIQVFNARDIKQVVDLRTRVLSKELNIKTGAVISEKFAKANKISVGDQITIESINGIKAQVKITGICEMYANHYLFMSEDTYSRLFDEQIHYNRIAITTSDVDSLKSLINTRDDIVSMTDFQAMIDKFNVMLQSLNFIVAVIIIASGSLAFVVVMNLTEVNISERIREIATLKVLGFKNNEVNHYIFTEVLILTLIGALTGLPLGTLAHSFVMSVIDMEMIMYGKRIMPISYLYAFAITMIFTIVVLLMTRKTLRKVEMVESLKSVE